jgi:predicted CXXCH cytochrome family protein
MIKAANIPDIILLNYSTEAPVAWTNPDSPSLETAVVMCLSCHRPHGSNQPDMLRWDYRNMIAGDDTKSGGCFTCHTTKNDP